ncbi:MAG: YIP1 family protein [Pseudomonadota bacterium]|nr:YIP1 family protein [Pseudomonadota bacterium]
MKELKNFIQDTLKDPRSIAEKSKAIRFSPIDVLQAVLFVAICSTLLTYAFLNIVLSRFSSDLSKNSERVSDLIPFISEIEPVFFTANQVFQMLLLGAIITLGGRIFGGSGKFFDALLCITWIEFILALLKILQLILLPLSSLLAFAFIVPGILWSLWAYAAVAAQLHGFRSTLMTLLAGFVICFCLVIILNIIL